MKTLKKNKPLTRGEKVCLFIETYCIVPEGSLVGKNIVLAPFQRKFILAIYDNPAGTSTAILSMARKNAKSATISCIVLAHIIGPERVQNAQIIAGALSKDQSALIYNLCEKMLMMQPKFRGLYKAVFSTKRIIGLKANTEFRALAAEGKTTHGMSPILSILDEVGQVVGPSSPFIDAILTAQGAHDNPLTIMISTQAASDADFLSLRIDDAIRSGDPHTVCHVYAADEDCELMDEEQWKKANPAMGLFRSEKDLRTQLERASRIPATENTARNLLLNQRISQESLWLAPSVWKSCGGEPNLDVFRESLTVSLGLDLSMRNDLTAAVCAVKDDDKCVHLLPFIFTPESGIRERELRDKAPYTTWVNQGFLNTVPGVTLDYDWIAQWLQIKLKELRIPISTVQFDRWRIEEFKKACQRQHFAEDAAFVEVGQGYVGFSTRIEAFETYLLQEKLRHGGHPLLNMAAANAIVISDPAGNRKIDKSKSTQRIDPLVAAVMAVGAFMVQEIIDIDAMIA